MSENFKGTLFSAFRPVMRPLVRILVRNGVTFGEFAELLKRVFVEAAQELHRGKESRQSVSRIAITTGLSKDEVGRLVNQTDADLEALTGRLSRVGRLLTGWHQDAEYTGPYGIPYEVSLDAPRGRRSFRELARRYTPDVSAEDLLDELKRINAVLELGNGTYRVLIRSYIPAATDPAKFHAMSDAFTDLARTLDHNLSDDQAEKRLERRVWSPNGITHQSASEFGVFVSERGQQFLESLDDWLSNEEREAVRLNVDERVRVGLAMYVFIRPDDELTSTDESGGSRN
jgi:hypothetical protein